MSARESSAEEKTWTADVPGPDEETLPDPPTIGFVYEVESDGKPVVPPDEND